MVKKPKICEKIRLCWMNKDQLCNKLWCQVAFCFCFFFTCDKILRKSLIRQFSISKYLWQYLSSSMSCLVCYCDVEFCVNLFDDIIGYQSKIVSHHKHNDIAHKKYHCLMMIEFKYRHVTCILSCKTSNLEVSTCFFGGLRRDVSMGTPFTTIIDKLEWC